MIEFDNSIPHKIHYCWFGGKPLPELAQKCIASWKKFLPDCEIIEWNESNYDVRKIPYTAQAYDVGKYAFVSDYARFDILYRHGGVYFDTDVEVIKPLDDILARGAFAGVESAEHPSRALAAGLGLASPAASPVYREILDSYEAANFLNDDGSMNLTTVVERVSGIFRRHGLSDRNEIQEVAGIAVYPAEYFCPKDFETGELNITENTYSIHHFDGSWGNEYDKQLQKQIHEIYKKYGENGLAKFLIVLSGIKKKTWTFWRKNNGSALYRQIYQNKNWRKEMVTNGGEEFNINNDKMFLEINSPKSHIGGPYKVLHKDRQERWAVVVLKWDKKPRLGIRWFWDSCGTPNSRGYSTWFVVPPNLAIAVLNGLPLTHDTRLLVEDFLCRKVQEDVFSKSGVA